MNGVDDRIETALNMHDQLMLSAPDGVSHDGDLCPFCRDWAMAEDGVPLGHGRVEMADAQTPYGPVEYADPGYQPDKVKRYPVDTEAHARAAWSYIHQAGNAEKYSADQLSSMRQKIQTALDKFGVEADQKEVERTKKLADAKSGPAGPKTAKATDAKGGSQKPKKASTSTDSSQAEGQLEVTASEGGNSHMDTITQETHEALLEKALRDATASREAETTQLTEQVTSLTETLDAANAQVASLTVENERLNGELDTAQVELKAAQDETAALKADIAAKDEAAVKAEVASERAGQIRNLGLFSEEYITERASRWADLEEVAWTERVDEWKAARGQTAAEPAPNSTDTASAMTGSNEGHEHPATSARRLALGLA